MKKLIIGLLLTLPLFGHDSLILTQTFSLYQVNQEGFENKDFVGQYVLDQRYDYMVITEEEGNLFAQPTGQTKKELFHNEELEFFLPGNEATITFTKDKQGEIAGLVVRYEDIEITGEKVG